MRRGRRAALAAIAMAAPLGLLAGCGSLLTSDGPPDQVFVLRPTPLPPVATPAPVSLRLQRTAVEPGLDGPRIALVRPGNRLDYYAAARWAGSLAEVFDSLAAQSLRASGAFASIDSDRAGFGADYVLAITVRRFEAEYAGDAKGEAPPVARVHLECTVGHRRDRRTIVTFDVHTQSPAEANRLGAVVAALERAANEAMGQVIGRSAEALARL